MKRKISVLLLAAMLLCLAACKTEDTDATANTVASTEPAVVETTMETVPETEPTEKYLLQEDSTKVCVGFVPTEAGFWRYAVIEDQEAAVAAFETAVSAQYSDEWWIKGDRTTGLMVAYNGEFWDFVESGELVCALGRVKAEDAAPLYDLCAAAARNAGWKDAVTPQQLHGLRRAVLRQGEKEIRLEDADALQQLEGMLSNAEFVLGGTGCPFSALLDLELEGGETVTIALATDSCGSWMSEGYYYDYGSDSQPLFDLFGVTMEVGKIQ